MKHAAAQPATLLQPLYPSFVRLHAQVVSEVSSLLAAHYGAAEPAHTGRDARSTSVASSIDAGLTRSGDRWGAAARPSAPEPPGSRSASSIADYVTAGGAEGGAHRASHSGRLASGSVASEDGLDSGLPSHVRPRTAGRPAAAKAQAPAAYDSGYSGDERFAAGSGAGGLPAELLRLLAAVPGAEEALTASPSSLGEASLSALVQVRTSLHRCAVRAYKWLCLGAVSRPSLLEHWIAKLVSRPAAVTLCTIPPRKISHRTSGPLSNAHNLFCCRRIRRPKSRARWTS